MTLEGERKDKAMATITYIKTSKGTTYTFENGSVYKPGWLGRIGVGSARTVSDAVEIAKADSGSRVTSIKSH